MLQIMKIEGRQKQLNMGKANSTSLHELWGHFAFSNNDGSGCSHVQSMAVDIDLDLENSQRGN